MITRAPARHVSWPAERFFWAALDASVLGRRPLSPRARREELGYLFESVLPVPIEDVNPVYRRLPREAGRERYLACAVLTTALHRTLPKDTVALTPKSIPEIVENGGVEPDSLNVLVGPLCPAPVRSMNRRWLLLLAVVLAACTFVLMFGLERRIGSARSGADALTEETTTVYEEALGSVGITAAPADLPPERRLTAEVRRLQQTRLASVPQVTDADVSRHLFALIRQWPEDVHTSTGSLVITSSAITIDARVPDMGMAHGLVEALRGLEGWREQQPQTRSQGHDVSVRLRFERVDDTGGVATGGQP